ncbi:MAG: 6-phosphogluconolactonase [Planctomycetes bacterium]|nr:6-phosphogluconolactonase [Planctomycetota bacterium]
MDDRRSIIVGANAADARRLAGQIIATTACEAVGRHGQFTLALAGGTTPRPLYEFLAAPPLSEAIPWQDTQVFFGDERDVPADHADSNFRMAQDALLGSVPIRLENVHPMMGDADDLTLAARRYAEQIIRILPQGPDGRPSFDLIILGMGGDGHTASLFPGSTALDEKAELVACADVPVLSRRRMTFTLPLINAAANVLFLVTGKDKAEAIAKVLSSDPAVAAELPAGRVRPTHGKLLFVLDEDAARQTPYKP